MTQSPGPDRRAKLPFDDPAGQVLVIATGLTAVAGSTTWQVLWILAGAAVVLYAIVGARRPSGATTGAGG